MCTLTDEEYEKFVDGWGASPCSEYGACELCPFNDEWSEEE
jgi:hypothetical protein